VWIGGHDNTFIMRIDPLTDSASLHDLSMPDSTLPRTRTVTRPDGTMRAVRATGEGGSVAVRRAHARRMAAGEDGRIWLTDFNGGRVLSFLETSSIDEYASVNRRSEPYGIAVDSTGRVWFYERGNSEVVALDPATGERVRFRVPTAGAVARSIAIDDARGRVWLPLSDRGRIGLIRLRPEPVGGQR
jgi:streptogramin lyase